MEPSKQIAAAMSAVTLYLKTNEEATAAHHAPVTIPADVYRQLQGLYQQLKVMFGDT